MDDYRRTVLAEATFGQTDYAEPDLYLLADPALVAATAGATFRLCPLEKDAEPVLTLTAPWEGGDGQRPRPVHQDPVTASILHDPRAGRFHCWYGTHNRLLADAADPALGGTYQVRGVRPQGSTIAYATSRDGRHWEKPVLGGVPFEGSCANNLLRVAGGPILSDHLSGVVPNYVAGATSKLVGTVYSAFRDPIYPRGITQVYSDDGLAWTPHFPPTLPLDGDAHCLMWNSREQCYLCTTRSAAQAHIVTRLQRRGVKEVRNKRHIALSRSRDLVHWTPLLTVLEADEQDPPNAELYYMYVLPYGHAYLGFVQLFYIAPNWTYGPLEMQLALSRDLLNWQRVGARQPLLARGPAGSWDQAHVSLTTNPPHPEGDRLRFWYGGKDTEHWQAGHAALGSATLRRDGFACYEAGAAGGTVTTAPFHLQWATMPMVNVDARGGELRVEILGENDQPLPGCAAADCLPITGDHVRALVEFKVGRGTFIRHTGPVRFRFHLRTARLYAYKAPNAFPAASTDATAAR